MSEDFLRISLFLNCPRQLSTILKSESNLVLIFHNNPINGGMPPFFIKPGKQGIARDYSFDAYGNKISGGTTATPKSYRDQYFDSDTGLYYLNARYYDPTTGSFTQEDTYWGDIKSPDSLNLYGYCDDNPVLDSDILCPDCQLNRELSNTINGHRKSHYI